MEYALISTPALSKINWTQIVGAGAVLFSVFGFDVDPATQVQVVAGIALVTQVVTVVWRTFFMKK